MDLTQYVRWFVFLHVIGAFMFAAGHGVSMFAAFALRRERDRNRMTALVDLSGTSLTVAGIGLLVLLIAGIVAGIVLNSFGRGWIWVSLVTLVVIAGIMTPLGSSYFNAIRAGLGQRTRNLKKTDPDPAPVSDEELASIVASNRPEQLLVIGGVGLVVIVWLMMFRPF